MKNSDYLDIIDSNVNLDGCVEEIESIIIQIQKDAFEAARLEIKNTPTIIDNYDNYWINKYETFEDYLKDLNNDAK